MSIWVGQNHGRSAAILVGNQTSEINCEIDTKRKVVLVYFTEKIQLASAASFSGKTTMKVEERGDYPFPCTRSLLLFCVSSLCPKGSKTFLHFQLYFRSVSSLLRTKVFKSTAAGKRLQEGAISGALAILLELYETLFLGFDRKNWGI